MITIQVLGLDQFVVGHYSKEHTANIAQILEVDEAEVVFYAPNAMIFHKGVEQTSWNTVVNVLCPRRFDVFEKPLADYILSTLNMFSINIQVVFSYYPDKSEYEFVNDAYPRYLEEDNIKEADVSFDYGIPTGGYEEDEEGEEVPEAKDDGSADDLDSIYLGNAFEGFEEALEKKKRGN